MTIGSSLDQEAEEEISKSRVGLNGVACRSLCKNDT